MFQDLVISAGLDLIPNPFSRGEGAKSSSGEGLSTGEGFSQWDSFGKGEVKGEQKTNITKLGLSFATDCFLTCEIVVPYLIQNFSSRLNVANGCRYLTNFKFTLIQITFKHSFFRTGSSQ